MYDRLAMSLAAGSRATDEHKDVAHLLNMALHGEYGDKEEGTQRRPPGVLGREYPEPVHQGRPQQGGHQQEGDLDPSYR